MRKRTVAIFGCSVAAFALPIAVLLFFFLPPQVFTAVRERFGHEGAWDLEFPTVVRAHLLSLPRRIDEKGVDHAIGRWADGSPSIISCDEAGLEAKDADLARLGRLELGMRCQGVVDHESGGIGLVVLCGPGFHTSSTIVAFQSSQVELWRFLLPDAGTFGTAAPLYDEGGLYGFALGAGRDTGIVSVDLRGERLWDVPKQNVLYRLSTHPLLPGELLAVGGECELFHHARTGVDRSRPVAQKRRMQDHFMDRMHAFKDRLYATEGVLAPSDQGIATAYLAGVDYRRAPVVARVEQAETEVWRASLSGKPMGVALLGRRQEKYVLAAATSDRRIIVFDEDGTLLDGLFLPLDSAEDDFYVFAFDAGLIGADRTAITIDTNHGNFLIEVDLGGN